MGVDLFYNQKTFFYWHNEGFSLPSSCKLLAEGQEFTNQVFQCNASYGIQFHPEVNFKLHLRWLYYVLSQNPRRLFVKGSQNIIYQIYLRIKYNNRISKWLDLFLDQYFLKKQV